MGLLHSIVEKVSDHPVLFIFFRSILENDFKAIRAQIRRDMSVGKGQRVLDLGCGPGAFADMFVDDEYVGVDLNRRYIDWARQHKKGAFIVSDARTIDLPDQRFDEILVFGMLHHLSDEDVRAVLREMSRLLAPGGKALVIEDIPALHKLNVIGHLIHNVENGEHIRKPEEYRVLYQELLKVQKEEVLQSGICDYYAVVLTH
jgi:ubiquinone/menaquinone biosynthesis C-methylase UbiE